MGRGQSALKPEDIQVYNAVKWCWWQNYDSSHQGSDPDVYIYEQNVYGSLKAAYGQSPLTTEQIGYRLKKLAGRGLLEGSYGRYKIKDDPDIKVRIDDWNKD